MPEMPEQFIPGATGSLGSIWSVEWLCERCRTIHPPQPGGIVYHQCPQCGSAMIPTSPQLREIDALRARISALEAAGDALDEVRWSADAPHVLAVHEAWVKLRGDDHA